MREDVEPVRPPGRDERFWERSAEHPVEVIEPVVEHRLRECSLERGDLLDEFGCGVQCVALLVLDCLPGTGTLGAASVAIITVVVINGFGGTDREVEECSERVGV